jgi:hypothetical protein
LSAIDRDPRAFVKQAYALVAQARGKTLLELSTFSRRQDGDMFYTSTPGRTTLPRNRRELQSKQPAHAAHLHFFDHGFVFSAHQTLQLPDSRVAVVAVVVTVVADVGSPP